MTQPIAPLPIDRRRELVMRKFMGILNDVSSLGAYGFAHVIDSATFEQLAELETAADAVRKQIDRVKGPGT